MTAVRSWSTRNESCSRMVRPGTPYVLDAYALLAHLQGEPRGVPVRNLIRTAEEGRARLFLCVVNLAEVLYKVERRLGAEAAREAFVTIRDELPVELVPADLSLSVEAARLKAAHPISLADCYAAALARQLEASVLTGDPDFTRLQALVNVQWL